jgi:hypothetical protein
MAGIPSKPIFQSQAAEFGRLVSLILAARPRD